MSEQGCIVVGVDGSDGARRAVEVAAKLAVGLGSDVVAVHAFEPLSLLGTIEPPVDFVAVRDEVEGLLRGRWTEPLRDADVPHRVLVIEDHPVQALLRAARSEQAAHIVIGTRGAGGFKGLLLGSVALALPAAAQLPVTIVPPPHA